tara:strand:+ start:40 stop:924 length:885 start_codon:yes stop_codon:yes gene_type:complete
MGRGYSGNHPRYSKHSDERYDAKEAYNKDLTASARLHYLENDRHDHDSPAHGHCTPMKKHNRAHRLRERAVKISERSGAERGDEYDYENPKVMKLIEKAKKLDERSGVNEFTQEAMQEETNRMIDERGGSPFNSHHSKTADYFTKRDDKPNYRSDAARALDSVKSNKIFFQKNRELKRSLDRGDDERANEINVDLQNFNNEYQSSFINDQAQADLQEKQDERDERTRAMLAELERKNKSSSPMNACAKSEGGSGCIKQMGGAWRVISNKTDKPWPAKYASKSKAEAALRGYHAG